MMARMLISVRGQAILFILMLCVMLVVTLPLRAVMSAGQVGKRLSADVVRGTIWHGILVNTALSEVGLGDVELAASVFRVMVNKPALHVNLSKDTPLALQGYVSGAGDIDGMTGDVDLTALFRENALTGSAALSDLSINYNKGSCTAASGQIRAEMGIGLPGLPTSETRTFAGSIICVDGDVIADLSDGGDHVIVNMADGRSPTVTAMLDGTSFTLAP